MRPLVVTTVLLILVAPNALALDPLELQDDAGTGADAPDSGDGAPVLTSGDYAAFMDGSLDREDWFHVDAGSTHRMRISFLAATSSVFLQIRPAAGSSWQGFSAGNTVTYLSPPGGSYDLRFFMDEGATNSDYTFALDVFTPPAQADAGLPGDAGSTISTARDVPVGLHAGFLHPYSADTMDWYRFTPNPGAGPSAVTLTVPAGSVAEVILTTASGGGLHAATANGGSVTVSVTQNGGAVLVRTPGSAPVDYTFEVSFSYVPPPPPPPPIPQNDAGLGRDAGSNFSAAEDLPYGSYTGALEFSDGDIQDWYRMSAPAGHVLRVTFVTHAGFAFAGLYPDAGGDFVAQVSAWSGTGSRTMTVLEGTYRLGIGDNARRTPRVDYGFTVETIPVANARMLAIAVDAQPPEGGDPNVRLVHVDVENRGALAFQGASLHFSVTDSIGITTVFATAPLQGAGGSITSYVVEWDTSTYVGNFRITARAVVQDDPTTHDNLISVRASAALDPGLGRGVGFEV